MDGKHFRSKAPIMRQYIEGGESEMRDKLQEVTEQRANEKAGDLVVEYMRTHRGHVVNGEVKPNYFVCSYEAHWEFDQQIASFVVDIVVNIATHQNMVVFDERPAMNYQPDRSILGRIKHFFNRGGFF